MGYNSLERKFIREFEIAHKKGVEIADGILSSSQPQFDDLFNFCVYNPKRISKFVSNN